MSGSSSLAAVRPPFTAAQWQELELQALIYKYVVAGLPVPPNLLAPIRNSFDLMSARFFHHPSLGYSSFYGKKMDPEPGRCRRTDGKKWRCSKDAHPDSKYCERHMHRSRNRSRKPVESQTTSQSTSTVMSFATGSSSGSGSFENLPVHSIAYTEDLTVGSNGSQSRMEHVSFGINNKEDRYLHGMKREEGQQHFLPEDSESLRGLTVDPTLDDTWRLMPSQVPSNFLSRPINSTLLPRECNQLHMLQDFEPATTGAASLKHQQQYCFIGSEFGAPGTMKKEHQSPRPLFDEWLKGKDSCSDLDDQRSYRNSSSTTQLSISMAPSESFAKSACSPTDA